MAKENKFVDNPILERDIPRDKPIKQVVVQYTNGNIKGKPKETKDEKKTWAKTVNENKFIILDEQNKFYNHLDLVKPTGSSYRRPAKFSKVDDKTFDNYLKFLTTNNIYYLNLARRYVDG